MNNRDDSFSNLKFFQYYQLSSIPKATSLMEIEDSVTSAKRTVDSKTSESTILFGLGIISILLLIGGLQLQRSVNSITGKINTVQIDREFSAIADAPLEIDNQPNYKKSSFYDRTIESAIKNSIAKGKF